MNKSTETILLVAGGAALLYFLSKSGAIGAGGNCPTSICPHTGAVRTGAATNADMGGQNFGTCPGGWC